MSYTASFSFSATSGLSLKAALVSMNDVHSTYRDITATFYDDGGNGWQFVASLPDGARGTLFFYVGDIGVEDSWPTARAALKVANGNVDAVKAIASINPEDFENGDAKVSSRLDPGGTLARVTLTDTLTTYTGNTPQTADVGVRLPANVAMTGSAVWALDASGNPIAPASSIAGIPAAVRDVSNSSPASGSFGESARNADAKAAMIQAQTDQLRFTVTNQVDANVLTGGSSGPTLTEIRDAITTDHGAGSYIDTSAGTGPYPITITVHDSLAAAVPGASVRVTQGITSSQLTTDAGGHVTFQLDVGTWNGGVSKSGYIGQSIAGTVTGSQAGTLVQTVTLTASVPLTPPTDPALCTVGGYFINGDGTPAIGLIITFKLKANGVVKAGPTVVQTEVSAPATDVNGFTSVPLVRNTAITNHSRTVWLANNSALNMVDVQLYLDTGTYDIGNA